MTRILRWLYFTLLVRPVITIVLGINVRGRAHLPSGGPAIITANHNSHLDAMVLMSLLPHRLLGRVRPVAAEDYFMNNRFLAWFSTRIVGILPIARRRGDAQEDPLEGCYQALEREEVLIFFPEGSRGEPEKLGTFRGGIAKVASRFPDVPVVPVFMYGLGKALPRGEGLLVPFMLDIFIGPAILGQDHKEEFLETLRERILDLARENRQPEWD